MNEQNKTQNKNNTPTNEDMLEEYKLCHDKAKYLEGNVWKTATIFGIGSVVGIIALSNDSVKSDLGPILVLLVSFVAIASLCGWWRFVRRWLSIQQVMILRMKQLERNSQSIRINLYIDYFNDCKHYGKESCSPEDFSVDFGDINEKQKEEIDNLINNYEYRGIQPMLKFIFWTQLVAWSIFAILQWFILFKPLTQRVVDLLKNTSCLEVIALVLVSTIAVLYGMLLCCQYKKP